MKAETPVIAAVRPLLWLKFKKISLVFKPSALGAAGDQHRWPVAVASTSTDLRSCQSQKQSSDERKWEKCRSSEFYFIGVEKNYNAITLRKETKSLCIVVELFFGWDDMDGTSVSSQYV